MVYDNSDGAVGGDAMEEITEAVSRVEKANKRKEQPGWGESANKAVKPGGWGSNYSAQGQEVNLLRLVDGDKAVLLLRLGTAAKAKARAAKARARPRFLLLLVLLLLLLVAMLPLLMVGEADLVPTSVLIVGKRDTTRIRARNWPL